MDRLAPRAPRCARCPAVVYAGARCRRTWPLLPLLPLALSAALILKVLLCPPALTLMLAMMLALTLCLMALTLMADGPGGSDCVADGSDPEGASALTLKSLR